MIKTLQRKTVRRRVVRYSLIAANAVVLVAIFGFIFFNSHKSSSTMASALAAGNDSGATSSPVDRLTSFDIAANVASAINLPEQNAINNQAQSAKAAIVVSSSSDSIVVTKPQIVATSLKSMKDIQTYTVQSGEDVAAVAQKFNVTSDSIKWSNNLMATTLSVGTKLVIPPVGVSGVVYTVKAGDTAQSLATKYKANTDQITAYNDAELAGLVVGEQIIIPGGQVAPVVTYTPALITASTLTSNFLSTIYGGNGYDAGYCTWYAYNQRASIGRPVGSNWGNATSWASYGLAAGFAVDHTPEVGAVQQNGGGLGHVAVVTSVNADGSWTVSEMNYVHFATVSTRSLPASAAGGYNFIH